MAFLADPHHDQLLRQAYNQYVETKTNQRHLTHTEREVLCTDILRHEAQLTTVTLDPQVLRQLTLRLVNRTLGYGLLSDWLPPARADLSDLCLNADGRLWYRRKGAEDFQAAPATLDHAQVWRSLEGILMQKGRSPTEGEPSIDSKLSYHLTGPNGEDYGVRPIARLKVQHPVITAGQGFPSFSLRFYEADPVTPEQIVKWNVLPAAVMQWLLGEVGAGTRLVISGGTSTGKTTLLSALCTGIPASKRIVKIEDPEEIWLRHANVQTIEARPTARGAQVAPYTIQQGVDDAMRMAPQWLIVGEVRDGHAAAALFRAMMSNHPGLTTFHADGPDQTLSRLSILMALDTDTNVAVVPAFFANAVDLIVQIGWGAMQQPDGSSALIRCVTGIYEVMFQQDVPAGAGHMDYWQPFTGDSLDRQHNPVGFYGLWQLGQPDPDQLRPRLKRRT